MDDPVKHTFGKWYTGDTKSDSWGREAMPVVDESGKRIAIVSVRSEQKNNAFLIAAAPDLLEALKELRALHNLSLEHGRPVTEPIVEGMAEVAIKKAEGG